PELVANAIEDRLPPIPLKRSDAARLQSRHRLEGPEQGVLNQAVRVGQSARPPGQSSSSPALQRLDVALEQPLQCLLVPCTRIVTATRCETAKTHNAPSRAPDLWTPLRECAQSSSVCHSKPGDFPVEFDDGGGLKNRCRSERKLDSASADFTYT